MTVILELMPFPNPVVYDIGIISHVSSN